jgi:hypothetical protein
LKKTILGIPKDLKTKNWHKTNFEAEKDRKLIKGSQNVVRTRSPKGHMNSHKNNFLHINSFGK